MRRKNEKKGKAGKEEENMWNQQEMNVWLSMNLCSYLKSKLNFCSFARQIDKYQRRPSNVKCIIQIIATHWILGKCIDGAAYSILSAQYVNSGINIHIQWNTRGAKEWRARDRENENDSILSLIRIRTNRATAANQRHGNNITKRLTICLEIQFRINALHFRLKIIYTYMHIHRYIKRIHQQSKKFEARK